MRKKSVRNYVLATLVNVASMSAGVQAMDGPESGTTDRYSTKDSMDTTTRSTVKQETRKDTRMQLHSVQPDQLVTAKAVINKWITEENMIETIHPNIYSWTAIYIASINEVDENKETLLHRMVRKGAVEVVKYLLSNPFINLNIKNNKGESALDIAVDEKNHEIAVILIKNPEVDINKKCAEALLCNTIIADKPIPETLRLVLANHRFFAKIEDNTIQSLLSLVNIRQSFFKKDCEIYTVYEKCTEILKKYHNTKRAGNV
ncbi:MAG: ankyrin repeat domain-containing protein [Bacteroidota bacterium]